MSHLAVVDASVAIKWVLLDEFSDRADRLYAESVRVRSPLLAPSLLPNEVANAILQQLRRGRLPESEADAAMSRFLAMEVMLVSPHDLPRLAFAFAKAHGLKSVYDSLYVVLAQQLDLEFWTDDRRLLTHIGPAAPWVRWIGDYDG